MTIPCRIDVFVNEKRGSKVHGYAYQAWNPDPAMEREMARLPGSGSFYWPSARAAYREAKRIIRKPGVHQLKIETISGFEVGRLYAPAKVPLEKPEYVLTDGNRFGERRFMDAVDLERAQAYVREATDGKVYWVPCHEKRVAVPAA